jgi:hypothetical protein
MYKEHVESFARAFGVFMSVYFTSKWADKSAPSYDTWLIMIAAILGVLLAR